MSRFHSLSVGIRLFLIPVLLTFSLGFATPAASQPMYTYANGVQLAPMATLPFYHINTIAVTMNSVPVLTRNFSGIAGGTTPQLDAINGKNRFSIFNATNNTVLEQYGATGGFYAYNPGQAFNNTTGGTPPAALDAEALACNFILGHAALVPTETDLIIPGLSNQCSPFNGFQGYKPSTEWQTRQTPTAGKPDQSVALRLMVTVPLMLNTAMPGALNLIPLAGPGGHISMIFFNPIMGLSTNVGASTLDANTPGLQAVAMPAFGRSFTKKGDVVTLVPAVVQAQIQNQLLKDYPKGVTVPTPALEYYLTDASTPQLTLEPTLTFTGITVITASGQTLTLKDMTVPDSAPGALGPTVAITAPANASSYMPGVKVSLKGTISNGKAPYSYSWQLEDGTILTSGSPAAAGALPPFLATLPVPPSKGLPASLTVRLVVTDGDGITRQADVSLTPPLQLFLPAIKNKASAAAASSTVPTVVTAAPLVPAAPNFLHTFGVEYGSDYPPYGPGGPDLSGVPPDANGFSSGLWSLGYSRIFNWYNANAWEKDWRDCSLGGGDCTYGVDRAEFVYYSGHGNNGGIAIPSNSHDSGWFDGINARYQNARWVGFSSCLTLRAQWTDPTTPAPITRWFNAFQGAHMLLGFNSTMADIAFGYPLVDNMRVPTFFGGLISMPWAQRTIADAWVQTAFELNAGKPAYIYAWKTGVDPSFDKLPTVSDPTAPNPYPVEWFYWVWWDV